MKTTTVVNKLITIFLVFLPCFLLWTCASQKGSHQSTVLSQENKDTLHKQSIVEKLKENAGLSIENRIHLYHQLKKDSIAYYEFSNETELTLYGYAFLWENNLTDAIEVFKLIISEFPNSANAYDSMGEAYLQAGDSALALLNYQKSLELNPGNYYAEDIIEKIKYPHIKPLTAHEKFLKIYPKKQYLDDLDELGEQLLKIHPMALKFITKDAFLKNIEDTKLLITDSTTYGQFAWHCNGIIASVHCSHTSSSTMQNAYHENLMLPLEKSFPLQIRWVNDQLFIIDPLNNSNRVKIKDEIISINGIHTGEIMKDIFKHIPAQANIQTYKTQFFNNYYAILIPYALNTPASFNIGVMGKKETIQLNQAKTFSSPDYDPSLTSCLNELCLEIPNKYTAILTIRSFNYYEWDRYPVFENFIDSSMNVIHKKGIKNLIIDVRFNHGGSQYPSIYLLRHLANKPFTYYSKSVFEGKVEKMYGEEEVKPHENRFKGKTYFLMDGNGTSTTGHFMSLVKTLQLGTIIGEELGSNQFCTAGQTMCRLKNTKLEVSIANNIHISTATSLPDEIGILPDITVTQSIDEYLNKYDAVKEYALQLTKK